MKIVDDSERYLWGWLFEAELHMPFNYTRNMNCMNLKSGLQSGIQIKKLLLQDHKLMDIDINSTGNDNSQWTGLKKIC